MHEESPYFCMKTHYYDTDDLKQSPGLLFCCVSVDVCYFVFEIKLGSQGVLVMALMYKIKDLGVPNVRYIVNNPIRETQYLIHLVLYLMLNCS